MKRYDVEERSCPKTLICVKTYAEAVGTSHGYFSKGEGVLFSSGRVIYVRDLDAALGL